MTDQAPNPLHTQAGLQQVLRFAQAGRSLIPIRDLETKKPDGAWKHNQVERFDTGALANHFTGPRKAPGVAVVAGRISGGGTEASPLWLGLLDFDVKYSGPELPTTYADRLRERHPGLWERLPREITPSGGSHVYFISPVAIGNWKLAVGPDKKTWIETKGEGGYALCAPTKGYKWIREAYTLELVPLLTEAEADALLSLARELSAIHEAEKDGARYAEKEGLPGNDYVARMGFEDLRDLLLNHGWRIAEELGDENVMLTRPGDDKRDGEVSANLRIPEDDGPPLLYVYTSSTAFEAGKAYTAFQVRAFLDFDGDFRLCAKALRAEGFGEEPADKPKKPDDMETARRWIAKQEGNMAHNQGLGWRRWGGTHWQLLDDEDAARLRLGAGETARECGHPANLSKVKAILEYAEAHGVRKFDQFADMIPFQNGMLRMGDMATAPHSREAGNTYCLPFEFAPGRFPRIWAFLAETIPDPVARRAYMAHVGLAMMRDTRFYKILVLFGGKRSGKGTCLKLANLCCAQPATEYVGETIFSRDQEGLWARARHADKRVACIDELPVEALQSEDLIKTMATHEGVPMRPLHGREITNNNWRPKMLASTNSRPRFADPTGALRERLLVIECPNTHTDSPAETDPARRVDLYLLDKLLPDIPAFASICLLHARRALLAGHYPESDAMREVLGQITRRGDAFKSWMEDHCEIGLEDAAFTPTSVLFKSYETYCKAGGYRNLSQGKMADAIQAACPACRDTKRLAPIIDGFGNEQVNMTNGKRLMAQQRGLTRIRLLQSPISEEEIA